MTEKNICMSRFRIKTVLKPEVYSVIPILVWCSALLLSFPQQSHSESTKSAMLQGAGQLLPGKALQGYRKTVSIFPSRGLSKSHPCFTWYITITSRSKEYPIWAGLLLCLGTIHNSFPQPLLTTQLFSWAALTFFPFGEVEFQKNFLGSGIFKLNFKILYCWELI